MYDSYMKRKHARFLFGLAMSLAIMLIASWNLERSSPAASQSGTDYQVVTSSQQSLESEISSSTNALVFRVVDGDTLVARLDKGGVEAKVRLLGINTPETVDPRRPVECFGKQASDYAKKLLSGQRVQLVADPEADEIDKYGRLLRNVYLADGTDFNAEMIRQGYAYAYVSFPQNAERKAYLRSLEAEARENLRGLWNPSICPSE